MCQGLDLDRTIFVPATVVIFQRFSVEPEDSLLRPQEPITGFCPESDEFIRNPPMQFLRDPF